MVVAEFVKDRDADLAAQLVLVDATFLAGGQLHDAFPKYVDHVGQNARLVDAAMDERHARVKSAELAGDVSHRTIS